MPRARPPFPLRHAAPARIQGVGCVAHPVRARARGWRRTC
jgi:hypothetical protein